LYDTKQKAGTFVTKSTDLHSLYPINPATRHSAVFWQQIQFFIAKEACAKVKAQAKKVMKI